MILRLLLILSLLCLHSTPAAAQTPVAERTKYLLLGSRLIESTSNAVLRVGKVKKHPANPLFGEDKPWELRYDNMYPNVIYDEEERLFKCWYSAFIIDQAVSETPRALRATVPYKDKNREMAVLYAVSKDGLRWEKPALGIVEFNGSRNNNILSRASHGAGVFKDLHETDPARRYKMLFAPELRGPGDEQPGARYGLAVRFSRDGIHWTEMTRINRQASRGDADHTWVWAPERGKYVAITRPQGWKNNGRRIISRTV